MTFLQRLRWRQGPRYKAESTRADRSLAHFGTLSETSTLKHATPVAPGLFKVLDRVGTHEPRQPMVTSPQLASMRP